MPGRLAIGLMSGTSADGISAALVCFGNRSFKILSDKTHAYPKSLRERLQQGASLQASEISSLNVQLGEIFAQATHQLLHQASIRASRISVIGSHGHTLYHGPRNRFTSTLQIGDAAILAQRTGIPVIADFRSRDIAAGGEGAPLIPFFDQFFFGRGKARALQNIGGIGNVAVVGRTIQPIAFDTGPGNCLMDWAAQKISRGRLRFDPKGRMARCGSIHKPSIRKLAALPYFRLKPPKSTGRELFNEALLKRLLPPSLLRNGYNLLATLTYFTAWSIAQSYERFVTIPLKEVIVSGGGAYNETLIRHLAELLAPVPIRSIADYGIRPQAKEPVAFAFLALRALNRKTNHLPYTTGARSKEVLGSLTPGR